MLGHQRFEIDDGLLVEAPQITVDGIDTGHDSARHVREDRASRQRFDAEHALLASRGGINEQLDLCLHRVDDHGTRLQAKEQFVQSSGNAEVSNEATELHKAAVAGQTLVRPSKVNLTWVGTMDTASAKIR